MEEMEGKKYCKHCGEIIDKDCVICPKCGKQVEELNLAQPQVIVNNTNTNTNVNTNVNGLTADKELTDKISRLDDKSKKILSGIIDTLIDNQ
mgnify:CR=1 FL=1